MCFRIRGNSNGPRFPVNLNPKVKSIGGSRKKVKRSVFQKRDQAGRQVRGRVELREEGPGITCLSVSQGKESKNCTRL